MIPWVQWVQWAFASVSTEAPPSVGVETVIVVMDELGEARAGETVRALHRPGLPGARELAIGITDARGRVRWTPAEGGIAQVRAGDEVVELGVARSRPPELTATLLALLGLLVSGLWGMAFRAARRRA